MKKSEALSILGLPNKASEDEIKKAHRRLIIENHPDKFGQDEAARTKAEEKTKLINEARDVLLTGKGDPEYSGTQKPYNAPYSYNPYTKRPDARGQGGQNPFDGWPFPEGTFVWTTWDSTGKRTTYTSNSPFSSGNPFTEQNPFSEENQTSQNKDARSPFWQGVFPFGFSGAYSANPPTPEELLAREKQALKNDLELVGIKVGVLALCLLLGFYALGLYLYTIISIGQGIYKRLSILSIFLVAPLVLLALIFLPNANTSIGFIGIFFFVMALGFDVSNIYTHIKKIRSLKKAS